ncbi:MAG: hypothetical protein D6812_13110, partial [Deltaproteobacteria bacterium]
FGSKSYLAGVSGILIAGLFSFSGCVNNEPIAYTLIMNPSSFAGDFIFTGGQPAQAETIVPFTAIVARVASFESSTQGQALFEESAIVAGVDVTWSSTFSETPFLTNPPNSTEIREIDLIDFTERVAIQDLRVRDVYVKLQVSPNADSYGLFNKFLRVRVVDMGDPDLDAGDCTEENPGGDDRNPCSPDGALQVENLEVEDLFREFSEGELLQALADNLGYEGDPDDLKPQLQQIKLDACTALDRRIREGFELGDQPLPIKPKACIAFEEGGSNEMVFRVLPFPSVKATDSGGNSTVYVFFDVLNAQYTDVILADVKGSLGISTVSINQGSTGVEPGEDVETQQQ